MRGVTVAVAIALASAGCATPSGVPYLDDLAFRRGELEASLVNPSNGYSQLRLAQYGLGTSGWDARAEWNPRTEPVLATGDLGAPLSAGATALDLDIDPTDDANLRALGEAAFFRYPAQPLPSTTAALEIERYGVWTDPVRGAGGLVRVEGGTVAGTCSTCHAASRDGGLVIGLANERFDLGQLTIDAGVVSAMNTAAVRAWGPGRVDVTTAMGVEPVRIPDLRAVQWLTFLQADATVQQRDLATLAIRIETLIITVHDASIRPPRIVALALAAYLWSLAETLPPAPSGRGADVFATACAGCHAPPALTGDPIPLDVIGTDPTVGRSAQRGTGAYRVPSLHGVAARGLLLHDGAVRSLDAMFDPARTTATYRGGVRLGPVPGHLFGLDLDAASRADLLAYLETL